MDFWNEDGLENAPRIMYVTEPKNGSDSSDADVYSSDDEEMRFLRTRGGPDVPSEYWHIQKLIKYIKSGDQTATNVSLCILKDHDLTSEINQIAIRDVGGLEVLVNILETEDHRCKSGSLAVLNEISRNPLIRRDLTDLGVIPLLVEITGGLARDLQILAAETIAKIATVRCARRYVRKCQGIHKLVEMLEVSDAALSKPLQSLNEEQLEEVDAARAAARALWTLTRSDKNKEYIMKSGCVGPLARTARSVHVDVVLPSIGTLQECATENKYQVSIQAEGLIADLVRYLTHANKEIVKLSALAIYKCADDLITRDQVREEGGLDPLVNLAKNKAVREDKALISAITGAIFKCALTKANVRRLEELRTVDVLVSLLDDENDLVRTYSSGGIAEMCVTDENRNNVRMAHGLPLLVNLLNYIYEPMLANVAVALGRCANNPECMLEIEELDGVRLIWSLLKNKDTNVQAKAAAALVPCVKNAFDSGEMVRSFVGGLELIVSLLRSRNNAVLTSVCAAIAQIAQDRENLGVITDHGVVGLLANLVGTKDVKLRAELSRAVASCCNWGVNCHEFGRLGAIRAIVGYMYDDDPDVHKTTALAIHQLSADPFNCIELHASGVVKFLLITIGSRDHEVQTASAGALCNMRKLALEAENFKFSEMK